VYVRLFQQGNHHAYGHIRCRYTVLANPSCMKTAPSDNYQEKETAKAVIINPHNNQEKGAAIFLRTVKILATWSKFKWMEISKVHTLQEYCVGFFLLCFLLFQGFGTAYYLMARYCVTASGANRTIQVFEHPRIAVRKYTLAETNPGNTGKSCRTDWGQFCGGHGFSWRYRTSIAIPWPWLVFQHGKRSLRQ